MPEKKPTVRCAIYTRKSTDEGLDQDFNSLDAQRESGEAYIQSQRSEGWELYPERYDDAGYSGGNMDRPALRRLLHDARAGKFQMVVVYKIDRLTRSLKDFQRIVEILETAGVSFVAVTQQFNTSTSMGRLTLNILLSFAQFEREMISERTRDKRRATAKKGKWLGGMPVLGYDLDPGNARLLVNADEAEQVRALFATYLERKSLSAAARELNERGLRTKTWVTRRGLRRGGNRFNKANLSTYLRNPIYLGRLRYMGQVYDGEHESILDAKVFDRVQDLLAGNGAQHKSANKDKHDFLLRGLVRCATCGTAMTPNFAYAHGRKYFYYKCVSVTKTDKDACTVRSAPARELEKLVLKRLWRLSGSRLLVDGVVEQARTSTAGVLPELRKRHSVRLRELGKLKEEARNLLQALGGQAKALQNSFVIDRLDELQGNQQRLEAELNELKVEIARWEERVVDADLVQRNLAVFRSAWERLTPDERKEALALLLEQVNYDEPQGQITLVLRQLPDLGPVFVNQDADTFDQRRLWLPG